MLYIHSNNEKDKRINVSNLTLALPVNSNFSRVLHKHYAFRNLK